MGQGWEPSATANNACWSACEVGVRSHANRQTRPAQLKPLQKRSRPEALARAGRARSERNRGLNVPEAIPVADTRADR
jgi:hypothetical protein